MKKTYQPKAKEVKREHHEIDAANQILGRLSTKVAGLLMGKHKAGYSTHIDVGDFVTIKNASKISVSGKKESQKKYFRHSGFPGGLKEIKYSKLKASNPSKVIELAVKRMLPKNRLQNPRMRRLKVSK